MKTGMKIDDIDIYEDREFIYHKAIETYGDKKQIIVAIEEMSELTKVLCKFLRQDEPASDLWDNLKEEMADAQIMLEQLRLIFTGTITQFSIQKEMVSKLIRLLKNLKEGD